MTKTICVVVGLLVSACIPPGPMPGPMPGPNAYAPAPAVFSGTYAATGGSITLQQTGTQVTGTAQIGVITASVEGIVDGAQLRGELRSSAGAASFTAFASAEGLQITLDGGQPVVLARTNAMPAGASERAAPIAPIPAPNPIAPNPEPAAVTGKQPPAPASGAAPGDPVRDELEGWEVRTPANWRHEIRDGRVVFGGVTEAGAIFVSYLRGVSYDQMSAGAEAQVRQLGATPTGPARAHNFSAGRGQIIEVTAMGNDGVAIYGRAIGIAGPQGVVSVFGLTTKDKFDTLRKRVDAIAQSARFFTAKPSVATADMQHLVGPWWHYHSTGSGSNIASYQRTLELCADGTFFDSDESNISLRTEPSSRGTVVSANRDSQDHSAGRWTSSGNNTRGTLRLVHRNGNVEQHTYVFKKPGGGDIELDGRWYGYSRKNGGRCR